LHELESPIDLRRRIISHHHVANLEGKCSSLMELLKYKWQYEVHRGFGALTEAEQITIGSEELLGLLFDVFAVRGSHMLDLAPGNHTPIGMDRPPS
jgi:hypothetical protein